MISAACFQQFGTVPAIAEMMQVRPRSSPPPPSRPVRRPPPTRDVEYEAGRLDTIAEQVRASRDAEQRARAVQAITLKARLAQTSSARQARLRRTLEKKHGLSFVNRRGQLTLIRHREILGINMTDADREYLKAQGFKILRRQALRKIGVVLDLYLAPEGMTNDEALDMVHSMKGKGLYRHNAVYHLTGTAAEQLDVGEAEAMPPDKVQSGQGAAIGLLDTGVYDKHKSFKEMPIVQHNLGRGVDVMPRDHGTAVAGLLRESGARQIFVADVFSGPALFADVEAIILGLNWLAEQGVGVINISLAGPPDDLLAHAAASLVQEGYILVAAVGNEGPEGPLMYPAAYAGVVGVTAVDTDIQLYEDASRGQSVDFASYGVKVRSASLKGTKKYTGTSFAAPAVSGFLSRYHSQPDRGSALRALDYIHGVALDRGEPGYDLLYGYGFLAIE